MESSFSFGEGNEAKKEKLPSFFIPERKKTQYNAGSSFSFSLGASKGEKDSKVLEDRMSPTSSGTSGFSFSRAHAGDEGTLGEEKNLPQENKFNLPLLPSSPPFHSSSVSSSFSIQNETKAGSAISMSEKRMTNKAQNDDSSRIYSTSIEESQKSSELPKSSRLTTLAEQLQEEFRKTQLARKVQRVQDLVLGKGLGDAAEGTLKESYYVPTKVFKPISEEDKKVWGSFNFLKKDSKEKKKEGKRSSVVSFEEPNNVSFKVGQGLSTAPSILPVSGRRGSALLSDGTESNNELQGERIRPSTPTLTCMQGGSPFSSLDTEFRLHNKPENVEYLRAQSQSSHPASKSAFSTESGIDESKEKPLAAIPSTSAVHATSALFSSVLKSGIEDEDDDELFDDGREADIMDKFCCTYKPIQAIADTRMEVSENIRVAEKELSSICSPFSLEELLETLSIALNVIERGYLHEKVSVPMLTKEKPSLDPRVRAEQIKREKEDPLYLTGALEMLEFVKEHVLPMAYEAVSVSHSVQWMLLYTVTFLQSLAAQTMKEAEMRVDLLSQCVRLISSIENLAALSLSIVAKREEYDSFAELKLLAGDYMTSTVDDVEKTLRGVLHFPFPERRKELQLIESQIQEKIRCALLLLNEIDTTWVPVVYYQMIWKHDFMSAVLKKIHCRIAVMYVSASMGFVDKSLYELDKDTREIDNFSRGIAFMAKVPRATLVEYERVTKKTPFEVIAISLKGIGSRQVGLQLCMGSRYILKQCGEEFDSAWGFSMSEYSKENLEEERKKMVMNLFQKVRRESSLRRSKTGSLVELSAED